MSSFTEIINFIMQIIDIIKKFFSGSSATKPPVDEKPEIEKQ